MLRGHSRGVWCAAFSPADRLVATGGGDAVVRMWSLAEVSVTKYCAALSNTPLLGRVAARRSACGSWRVTRPAC